MMMRGARKEKAAPVARGSLKDELTSKAHGRCHGSAPSATEMSAGLHHWAARHAARLAARFVAEDVEGGDPRAYFERHAGALALTSAYRGTAEPAFMACVIELQGAHDAPEA